ncbi:hypothetical protein Tco_1147116 [Tanacetum coccineum]
MRILSVVRIKAYSRYGYDYLKEIKLRRADHQEYTIVEKDFKNLYPNNFEDLNLLLLQGHLNHLPGSDIRFEFKHDYTIIDSPRAVVLPVSDNERKIMRFNEIYKFNDGARNSCMPLNGDTRPEGSYRIWNALLVDGFAILTTDFFRERNDLFISFIRDNLLVSVEVLRYDIKRSKSENKGIVLTEMELVLEQTQQVDIKKVAVRSSLRSLKPKCTIESRAKRSSINLIRTLSHVTCSSHNVKARVIIRVLCIILVVLPEHPSDTYVFTIKMEILLEPTSNKLMVGKLGDYDVHKLEDPTLILEILSRRFFLRLNLPDHRSVQVKIEMEIPRTSRVYFITAYSYSTNTSNDIMKVQAYVSKLPQL